MITLTMTDEQMALLEPLFAKVTKTYKSRGRKRGSGGVIILQPRSNGGAIGTYIPPDYSEAIDGILEAGMESGDIS